MQTIAQFLIEHFGPEAAEIEGVDNPYIGGSKFGRVRFTLGSKCGGRLQVKCGGGDCIMSFTDAHPASRCTYFLIHDDSEGEQWDAQARAGVPFHERKPTYYRPHARLRLVVSA